MNINIKEKEGNLVVTVSLQQRQKNERYQRYTSTDVLSEVRKMRNTAVTIQSGPSLIDNKHGPITCEWIMKEPAQKKHSPSPAVKKPSAPRTRRQKKDKEST